jgi:small-conductance mechanosensitive channel
MLTQLDALLAPIGFSATAVVALAVAAAIGLLAAFAVVFVVKHVFRRREELLADHLVAGCSGPLYGLLPVVSMYLTTPGVALTRGVEQLLPRVLSVLAVALAGWLAVRAVRAFVAYVIDTHSIDSADNFYARQVQTQIRVLGRVVVFTIIVATFAGVLVAIPSIRSIGVSLFASAGIAGLALGLAARPALANLIAGIQIALTQPIRLEDAVVVEGEWGWIEEINMTFVVVRIWDLRRLVLPISYLIEKPFQNWTRTTADILGSVMLYVDYNTPVDEIRAEFENGLRASKYWDGKVSAVHVTECTERTMQVRLLMSASNSPNAWELRCEIRERLIGYLQREHPQSLPRLRLETADDAAADGTVLAPTKPSPAPSPR